MFCVCREKLRSLKWTPIVYSTAINCIVVAAATVQKERSRRLCTAILNQVIRELAVAFKPSDMKLFSPSLFCSSHSSVSSK
ncbi:hypothetical protein Bca4012_090986 [Brassica carinata]|uniref:Uncharacterized protein n=1 Tax=Brassica napus TaxID=3708 RepID=A0ABQ8BK37_BRANA|nr:hypothetical protein HID58_044340 [Brassica napus]